MVKIKMYGSADSPFLANSTDGFYCYMNQVVLKDEDDRETMVRKCSLELLKEATKSKEERIKNPSTQESLDGYRALNTFMKKRTVSDANPEGISIPELNAQYQSWVKENDGLHDFGTATAEEKEEETPSFTVPEEAGTDDTADTTDDATDDAGKAEKKPKTALPTPGADGDPAVEKEPVLANSYEPVYAPIDTIKQVGVDYLNTKCTPNYFQKNIHYYNDWIKNGAPFSATANLPEVTWKKDFRSNATASEAVVKIYLFMREAWNLMLNGIEHLQTPPETNSRRQSSDNVVKGKKALENQRLFSNPLDVHLYLRMYDNNTTTLLKEILGRAELRYGNFAGSDHKHLGIIADSIESVKKTLKV